MGNDSLPNQPSLFGDSTATTGLPRAPLQAIAASNSPEMDSQLRNEIESALSSALTLRARRDPAAETAFQRLLLITDRLVNGLDLQMRAHEEYGIFLYGQRAFGRATSQFRTAWFIAECVDAEGAARLLKQYLKSTLACSGDGRLKALENLEKAVRPGDLQTDELEVWWDYCAGSAQTSRYRLAARKGEDGSVDYFRRQLDAKRISREINSRKIKT